jgi:hypothetical protein
VGSLVKVLAKGPLAWFLRRTFPKVRLAAFASTTVELSAIIDFDYVGLRGDYVGWLGTT